jgi:hypothetical protein
MVNQCRAVNMQPIVDKAEAGSVVADADADSSVVAEVVDRRPSTKTKVDKISAEAVTEDAREPSAEVSVVDAVVADAAEVDREVETMKKAAVTKGAAVAVVVVSGDAVRFIAAVAVSVVADAAVVVVSIKAARKEPANPKDKSQGAKMRTMADVVADAVAVDVGVAVVAVEDLVAAPVPRSRAREERTKPEAKLRLLLTGRPKARSEEEIERKRR